MGNMQLISLGNTDISTWDFTVLKLLRWSVRIRNRNQLTWKY